ncbi:hypothetical protein HDU91_004285 [Kappamyces sp. JEL0680]|nr:hypothetical protein HDU91_004285 [Kappamyces sp. JEL0680]
MFEEYKAGITRSIQGLQRSEKNANARFKSIELSLESTFEMFSFKINLLEKRLSFAMDRLELGKTFIAAMKKENTRLKLERKTLDAELDQLRLDRRLLLDRLKSQTDVSGPPSLPMAPPPVSLEMLSAAPAAETLSRSRLAVDPQRISVLDTAMPKNGSTSDQERINLLEQFSKALIKSL